MRHIITEQELHDWLHKPQWQLFASSASTEGCKRLEVDSSDTHVFRVIVGADTVFLGADRAAAVSAYNEAR